MDIWFSKKCLLKSNIFPPSPRILLPAMIKYLYARFCKSSFRVCLKMAFGKLCVTVYAY